MTHCTATTVPFSSAKRRKIEADFSGGVLTSDAGALLLREADRQLGLIDALDRALPDPRNPELIAHPQRALLAQRIFAIACGYEDLNDHDRLRDDPLWQTATDHPGSDDAPQLASPPTLCRLENRVRRAEALVDMAAALVEQFIAAPHAARGVGADRRHRRPGPRSPGEPLLPRLLRRLLLFAAVRDVCDHLLAYLRPADRDAARHSRAVLKLLVQRLRQAWPDVRIIVRADSGFCRWRLMRWCDRHGVGYLLGLAKNAVLQRRAAKWWQAAAEQAYRTDGQLHRVFGEFSGQERDRPRRVIAKAEHLPGDKANPRFVVTNLPGEARALYEYATSSARRQGEAHQGTAVGLVRGSDELPAVRGRPNPGAAGGGGVRLGFARPAGRLGRHGVGTGGSGDDSAALFKVGGLGEAECRKWYGWRAVTCGAGIRLPLWPAG